MADKLREKLRKHHFTISPTAVFFFWGFACPSHAQQSPPQSIPCSAHYYDVLICFLNFVVISHPLSSPFPPKHQEHLRRPAVGAAALVGWGVLCVLIGTVLGFWCWCDRLLLQWPEQVKLTSVLPLNSHPFARCAHPLPRLFFFLFFGGALRFPHHATVPIFTVFILYRVHNPISH